jgi:hypothetical protein
MAVLKNVIIHPMGIRRHIGHYKSRSIPFFWELWPAPNSWCSRVPTGSLHVSPPGSPDAQDIPGSLTPGPSIQSAPSPCAPSCALVGVLESIWGEWGYKRLIFLPTCFLGNILMNQIRKTRFFKSFEISII